jgi:peptidoglycan/LPS O-acetylase OafA/YrhL
MRALQGLALASYSIYLVHTLLFTDIRVLLGTWPRGAVKTGTILLATLLLSVVFYFAVERPTIVLRDRLLKG